jgi:hypothetical protein
MTSEAVAGQDRLHILVKVKMLARFRNAGMSGSAARHGRQQGNCYHHGGRRAEVRAPENGHHWGQLEGLRHIGDVGGSN